MTNLQQFIATHPQLFVLTGAGCSTESGIPDYRDRDGQWKRASTPVMYAAFMHEPRVRQRYWARSMLGWLHFRAALPNAAHRALVELERRGQVGLLVTQNVDRLHQRAGSRQVVDLHGRLDRVRCMGCGLIRPRDDYQRELLAANPVWAGLDAVTAPDGDAELEGQDFSGFVVPACPRCGGTVKPDVVFFGEAVPRERIDVASRAWQAADAVLVVGSSLMVYSGYRFVRAAALAGKPVAAVTLGHTRADPLLTLKLDAKVSDALAFLDPVQLQARPQAPAVRTVSSSP